jgi:hypothetical protein
MGSAMIQGDLWGQAPPDWALLQEPTQIPLFEAMLSAANAINWLGLISFHTSFRISATSPSKFVWTKAGHLYEKRAANNVDSSATLVLFCL